jgi:hypothetical protein
MLSASVERSVLRGLGIYVDATASDTADDRNRVILAAVGRIVAIFYRRLNGKVVYLGVAVEQDNNGMVTLSLLREAADCPCGRAPKAEGRSQCKACREKARAKCKRQRLRQRAQKALESAACTTAS